MRRAIYLLPLLIFLLGSCTSNDPILRIGLVADPQYEDRDNSGKRQYKESLWKLKEAIGTFNYNKVDFVQNLGDIINHDIESFDDIMPVYQKLDKNIPSFHLLGNHEFAVDSADMQTIAKTLSMEKPYYSYVKKNWRFIVLNSMDYSYLANPLYQRDTNKVNEYYNSTKGSVNHYDWNGAIGPEQQEWLKAELNRAIEENQDVIVFQHMPLLPEDVEERLWNSEEIVAIIEACPNVVAHINGHRHKGAYTIHNGIHYISIFGMVDTEVNSYGILEIYRDRIELKGYGHQKGL